MELVRLNKDNAISGNNTHSGTNVFSGNNSHSGTNVFSGNNSHSGTESFAKTLLNSKNVGIVGAATVVATESGDGVNHVTELNFTNFIVGPLAEAEAAKALVPPTPLYTLPAGVQLLEVSYAEVALTAAGTAVTPEIGLGSVIGDGSASATIGAAGATQEDILEGFAVATTLSHDVVKNGPKGATAGILTGIALNKAADAKTIYLNCAGTWNANNTGNLTATGKVVLVWKTIA